MEPAVAVRARRATLHHTQVCSSRILANLWLPDRHSQLRPNLNTRLDRKLTEDNVKFSMAQSLRQAMQNKT